MSVQRTAITPLMVKCYLEKAAHALAAGDVNTGRQVVERVLTTLQQQQAAENVVLDQWVVEPEQRAERVVEPHYPGIER